MQISKWGNSLAIRIPSDVARELGLREGSHVELRAAARDQLIIDRDREQDRIITRIRELASPLPPDFTFDREGAQGRGPEPD